MTKKYFRIPDFMVMLRYLGQGYETLANLHYRTMITYTYLIILKKEFLIKRWITIEKGSTEKEKKIVLTEKGKEMVNAINVLFENLGVNDENILSYRRNSKRLNELKEIKKEVE